MFKKRSKTYLTLCLICPLHLLKFILNYFEKHSSNELIRCCMYLSRCYFIELIVLFSVKLTNDRGFTHFSTRKTFLHISNSAEILLFHSNFFYHYCFLLYTQLSLKLCLWEHSRNSVYLFPSFVNKNEARFWSIMLVQKLSCKSVQKKVMNEFVNILFIF